MLFLKLKQMYELPYRRWPAESNGFRGIAGTALFYHPRICDECHGPIEKRYNQSYAIYAKRNFCSKGCKTAHQYKGDNPPGRHPALTCSICLQKVERKLRRAKQDLQKHKHECHAY
jgi:hypothetical protein